MILAAAPPQAATSGFSVLQQAPAFPVQAKAAELPANVSLNKALDLLRQKYSQDQNKLVCLQQPAQQPLATNGVLTPVALEPSTPNGRTFRFVKIRAFQGQPTPGVPTSVSTLTSPSTSLSEQLVKIHQMHTLPQAPPQQIRPVVAQPSAVRTVIAQPSAVRPSPLLQPVIRRTMVMSSPVQVGQLRAPIPTMQFLRPNGVMPASQGGPMKICIIQSPRKSDGSPMSPGSPAPGMVVVNPPQMRPVNFNHVLKAFSVQGVAQQVVAAPQQLPNVAVAVTPKVASPDTPSSLVKSSVS
jgi:hypothetical protein